MMSSNKSLSKSIEHIHVCCVSATTSTRSDDYQIHIDDTSDPDMIHYKYEQRENSRTNRTNNSQRKGSSMLSLDHERQSLLEQEEHECMQNSMQCKMRWRRSSHHHNRAYPWIIIIISSILLVSLMCALIAFLTYSGYIPPFTALHSLHSRYTGYQHQNQHLEYSAAFSSSNNNIDQIPIDLTGDFNLSSFERAVTVETKCLTLIGVVEENAFAFKGIPYADPPIGPLRWSRPIATWKETEHCKSNLNTPNHQHYYHAKQFGSQCSQMKQKEINGNKEKQQREVEFVGSEDCLYLNVWTPRLDETANLPVLVYVAGDLHSSNSQSSAPSPSGSLSFLTNSLFITFNSRLGPLGYLSMDILSNSGPNSSEGNYGLWDTLLVLEWIELNIAHFGGDKNKVTLIGDQAAADVWTALVGNCQYNHLMHSAWLIMENSVDYMNINGNNKFHLPEMNTFVTQSQTDKRTFLRRTNCSTIECLRDLSSEEVMRVYYEGKENEKRDKSLIVVDDELVLSPASISSQSFKCQAMKELLVGAKSREQLCQFINLTHSFHSSGNSSNLTYYYYILPNSTGPSISQYLHVENHQFQESHEVNHSSNSSAIGIQLREIIAKFVREKDFFKNSNVIYDGKEEVVKKKKKPLESNKNLPSAITVNKFDREKIDCI